MNDSQRVVGLRGMLIDSPEYGKLRCWRDGGLVIAGGRIAEVGDYETLSKKPRDHEVHWIDSSRNVILPGLIDLHSHLPQYPAVARGESDLLPWLRQHIFPLERDFTGPKCRAGIARFFQALASNGTTTAGVYSAIFEDSCHAAFEAARDLGIRALIGKVMMDVGSYGSHQPRKVVSISLHESERLCREWHGADDGRLEYAFSPRFAVSCSDKLMRGAAELAHEHGAYLQTHLAESREEINRVKHLFMSASDYTDVYDSCGMLGAKTLLGHCIHLSERELDVIAERGCAIAHCPSANLFLGSGIMPLESRLARGIPVGLGSDVAAGPELNLWRVMRAAVESQKARSFYEETGPLPGPVEALHMATAGGARALGKLGMLGALEVGYDADLVVMDIAELLPYREDISLRDDLGPEDVVSLAVYRGGRHAVVSTYVRGRKIHQAESQRNLL